MDNIRVEHASWVVGFDAGDGPEAITVVGLPDRAHRLLDLLEGSGLASLGVLDFEGRAAHFRLRVALGLGRRPGGEPDRLAIAADGSFEGGGPGTWGRAVADVVAHLTANRLAYNPACRSLSEAGEPVRAGF